MEPSILISENSEQLIKGATKIINGGAAIVAAGFGINQVRCGPTSKSYPMN